MKLGNFRALDPKSNLTGLQSYSKLDKMIFDEFSNNRVDLKRISKSIMETVENESFLKQLNHIEKSLDEIDAYEGEVLFKVHKFRERDIKIVELKKADHFKKFGKLECQVCDFDFYVTYGELGLNFIECHHLNHLSSYIKNQKTKLDDLALVCSNCHKMLHRLSTNMSLESLKEKLQKS